MGIWKGLGGHKFIIAKNKYNSWTDREQIWDTYAYSSGKGYELKSNPLIPEGHGS